MRAKDQPPGPTLATAASKPDDGQELALICEAAGNVYAVPLDDVIEVTRAVAVTAPSGDVDRMVGYIDLRGDLVPVVSGRAVLGLAPREVQLDDRFVVVHGPQHLAAVQVDGVAGVEAILVTGEPGPRPGLTVTRRAATAGHSTVVTRLEMRRLLPSEPHRGTARPTP